MPHAIRIRPHLGWLNPDKTINLKALNKHIAFHYFKILHEIDDYERKSGRTFPFPVSRPVPRGPGDVETDENNFYWFGSIEVGTPSKDFLVHFDTGSSDLFLPSAGCGTCEGHNLWDPSSSSTAVFLERRFQVNFGGGDVVEGLVFTDTVTIADLTATTQTLGAALNYSQGLQHPTFPADGLLGMGFQDGSTLQGSPLIQTLFAEGKISKPMFAFKLASSGGELFVGGVNPELYKGDFTYTPVLLPPLPFIAKKWKVVLERIQVNGQTVLENKECIIDTGTALVLGEPNQIDLLYSNTSGKRVETSDTYYHYYSFPCDSFPTISLTFGGTTFPISPSILNIGKLQDSQSECLSGVAGHPAADYYWIVGGVFLQNVYTAFDLGVENPSGPCVGFAELA